MLGVIPRAPVSHQKAVRDAVQESLAAMNANTLEEKANATLNTVLDRYVRDELPTLQLSTQETHSGTIENYIRPADALFKAGDHGWKLGSRLSPLKLGEQSNISTQHCDSS
jgi:hypothetical protein